MNTALPSRTVIRCYTDRFHRHNLSAGDFQEYQIYALNRPKLSHRFVDIAGSFAKQSGLLMFNVISIVGILVDTVECSYNSFWKGYGHRQDCPFTFRNDLGLKEALRIAAD